MATVIFTALIQTILNMFLKGAVEIASTILSVLDVLIVGDNPLAGLISIVQPDASFGTWGNLSIADFLYKMTYAIVILLFFFEVYRGFIAQFNGQNSENVLFLIGRLAVVGVLLFLLYGNGTTTVIHKNNLLLDGTDNNRTLLGILNQLFLFPLNSILPRVETMMDKVSSGVYGLSLPSANITSYVGIIIISGGLLASIISGAISILERAVTIVIYLMLGPLAIAFYTSKVTAQATIEWLKGLIIQYLVLDVSLIVWGLAIGKMEQFFNYIFVKIDWGIVDDILNIITGSEYIEGIKCGAVAIVLFSIAGNTEEIFGSLGFKMMSGLDSARIIGGGLNTAMSAVRTASMAGKGLQPLGEKVSEGFGNFGNKVLSKSPKLSGVGDILKHRPEGTTMAMAMEKSKSAKIPAMQNGNKKAYTPGKNMSSENAQNLAHNAKTATETGGAPNGMVDDKKYRATADAVAEACKTGEAVSLTTPITPEDSPSVMSDEERAALAEKEGKDISEIPAATTRVTAQEAATSISQIADRSENRLTANEKALKSEAIGNVYDPNSDAIATTAHTKDGADIPVIMGKDRNGDWAITAGGANVDNISSIDLPVEGKNGNYKMENVKVDGMSSYGKDYVTQTNSDGSAVQYFGGRSAANSVECTAGFSTNCVMKVNFKDQENNNKNFFENTKAYAKQQEEKGKSHGK